MDRTDSDTSHSEYRLVILFPGSQELLVDTCETELRLPRTVISLGLRAARELQSSIRGRWGVGVIILDFIFDVTVGCRFAIAEILSSNLSEYLSTARIDSISEDELQPKVRELAQSLLSGKRNDTKPLLRLGWIRDAIQWLSSEVDRSLLNSANIQQYNAGGAFALLRFQTYEGKSYWLKAVGSPNEHEFYLTRFLAQHFEDYIPQVLAHRSEWNAWVTKDCGLPLAQVNTYAAYQQALFSLGNLQINSVSLIDTLLDCGCADLRLGTLAAHTPALISYLEESMDRQTSRKANPVTSHRLREIGHMIEDACAEAESLGIPDTLLHNDLNPTNILIDNSHCVFIDWAEGAVGNAFLSFEYLRAQITNDADTASWMPSLDDLYRGLWRSSATDCQTRKGIALAKLLGIVAHLLGRNDWLNSGNRPSPEFEASARSLARHMDRVVRSDCFREALCK